MRPMGFISITSFFSLLCFHAAYAGPPPPIEDLLQRAETVCLARVVSIKGEVITFSTTASLRGKTDSSFALTVEKPAPEFTRDTEWLLISQGDRRYGPPRAVVGRAMEGQGVWRGWVPLAIFRVGGKVYVGTIYSSIDGPPYFDKAPDGTHTGLTLERVKQLLRRFRYNPHVNDKT